MKKYFTVALTVVVASAMFLVTSCNKSNNPTSPGDTTGGLTATPTSISLLVNGTGVIAISGGKVPYSVKSNSDSTKVRALVSNTTLSVTGLAVGTATIVVKDSAGTSTVSVPVTVASMIATPNSVTVVKGSNSNVTISGGTQPYTIQTVPTSTIATATISGSTLTITGVGAGSTSVVVKDNSAPANTVTVAITVTASGGSFTTAGTLAFSSDKGNFSANGIYSPTATSGTGAGAMLQTSSGNNYLTVYGYRINSATSYDITLVQFMDSAPIATGSFGYPPTSGSKMVLISYTPAMNPSDTTNESFYLLSSATANISAFTSSNAQGTFSGNGMYYTHSTPNPSQTIAITGGTFNVPVVTGGANPVNKKIEGIVKRILTQQKR